MELQCKLSDALLHVMGIRQEEIWYAAPYDIGIGEEYTREGYVTVTEDRFFVTDGLQICHQFYLDQIAEIKCESLVGGGSLVVREKGKPEGTEQIICRFTVKELNRMSFVIRGTQLLLGGVRQKVSCQEPEKTCPVCGRPLRGGRVCLKCSGQSNSWRRMFSLCRPYVKQVLIICLILATAAALRVLLPMVQSYFIDHGLSDGTGKVQETIIFAIVLVVLGVFSILMEVTRSWTCVKLGAQVSLDLRGQLYEKIQKLSISFVHDREAGELMNRMTGDTQRVRDFIMNTFGALVTSLLTMVVALVLMMCIDWRLSLISLCFVPVLIIVMRTFRYTIRHRYGSQYRKYDRLSTALRDVVSGMRVVKSFGKEVDEARHFEEENQAYAKLQTSNEVFWAILFPCFSFIMGMGLYFATFSGGYVVLQNGMTLGELNQFIAYAGMLFGPLGWISNLPRTLEQVFTSMERIYDVLEEPVQMEDNEESIDMAIRGDIEFRHATFGYRSYEPVLEDINLKVKQGEMIGLVGASGTGKSTLINLLMRLYDLDDGELLVDGVDIRKIRMTNYHSQLGVVLQETFLFSGTILDNLRFSKPEATYEEVIMACKMANAHDFIVRTPDGYNTYVGERGYGLSGGERQRIAIARAILNNPRLLILDEATSSLDTESEYLIQKAMERLRQGRTTFAIAHRLSTLKDADRLVVIDGHKIAEIGTHNELLEKKGIYYKLVMAQLEMQNVKHET